jgi:hypothetical protein
MLQKVCSEEFNKKVVPDFYYRLKADNITLNANVSVQSQRNY